MRWVAIFEDKPQMMLHRTQYATKHVDYVKKHQDKILIGGGLKESPEDIFVGALWIMEVQDKEQAINLIEADPFFHPKYRTYTLYTWGKILEDITVSL